MSWWQILFYPFAILYDMTTRFRNYLFDKKLYYSFQFDANVISVGNLSIGGSGKTPMTDLLIDHFLKSDKNVATLSRGYKRATKGFLEVLIEHGSEVGGDEATMLKSKFGENLGVFVGESRLEAIPDILGIRDQTDVIILDDAFQHRSVIPSVNILLTTYANPFYKDFVLPSGYLRESRDGASRSNIIVVTKCPHKLSYSEKLEITNKCLTYGSQSKVFYTQYLLGDPVPIFGDILPSKKVIAVAGLANTDQFFASLTDKWDVVSTLAFDDHYKYKPSDVKWMIKMLKKEDLSLFCTSKDAVKIREFTELSEFPCFEIPVEMKFLEREQEFFDEVERFLR